MVKPFQSSLDSSPPTFPQQIKGGEWQRLDGNNTRRFHLHSDQQPARKRQGATQCTVPMPQKRLVKAAAAAAGVVFLPDYKSQAFKMDPRLTSWQPTDPSPSLFSLTTLGTCHLNQTICPRAPPHLAPSRQVCWLLTKVTKRRLRLAAIGGANARMKPKIKVKGSPLQLQRLFPPSISLSAAIDVPRSTSVPGTK